MVSVGDTAPDFELPGTDGGEISQYRLSDYTESGPVILAFYPFDFSPVCADELCEFRDVVWLSLTDDVDFFGVSTDSAYAHRAFIEEFDLTFPLLSDSLATVCEQYGVRYDIWEEHQHVSKRALFLLDEEREVRYKWMTENALESPELDDVRDIMKSNDHFDVVE